MVRPRRNGRKVTTKIIPWGKKWKKPSGYVELRNEPSKQWTIFKKKRKK